MRVLLLALFLVSPLAAQTVGPIEALTSTLSLTADQADLAAEIFNTDDPSSMWTLAVELLPTLDASQREALFAQPERPEGARQGRRGEGQGGRGQGRRERDPVREATMKAARDAALGLTEAGSADLDAALASLDRREAAQSLRDGVVPPAIDDVLTADQIETYRAQMALQGHLRRAMRGSRRG